MSSKNPIVLSEGTFFEPQHFQQLVRAIDHQIIGRMNHAGLAYPYGFSELQINQEFLAFGKLAITRAKGSCPTAPCSTYLTTNRHPSRWSSLAMP